MPTKWLTLKGEAEYFTLRSTDAASAVPSDDYILYVVEFERQSGEWVFVGGYAGEVVTEQRLAVAFAPDRGMTKSFVGARRLHDRSSPELWRSRAPSIRTAVGCT